MTLPRLRKHIETLEAAREVRREELLEALKVEHGIISRAAAKLKLSRQRVTLLIKQFDLREEARKLRIKAGAPKSGFGRPFKLSDN